MVRQTDCSISFLTAGGNEPRSNLKADPSSPVILGRKGGEIGSRIVGFLRGRLGLGEGYFKSGGSVDG